MAEHGMQGGLPDLRITDVKAICTAPDGIRLVVVKVETKRAGVVRPGLRDVYPAAPRRRGGRG